MFRIFLVEEVRKRVHHGEKRKGITQCMYAKHYWIKWNLIEVEVTTPGAIFFFWSCFEGRPHVSPFYLRSRKFDQFLKTTEKHGTNKKQTIHINLYIFIFYFGRRFGLLLCTPCLTVKMEFQFPFSIFNLLKRKAFPEGWSTEWNLLGICDLVRSLSTIVFGWNPIIRDGISVFVRSELHMIRKEEVHIIYECAYSVALF